MQRGNIVALMQLLLEICENKESARTRNRLDGEYKTSTSLVCELPANSTHSLVKEAISLGTHIMTA